MTSAHSQPGEAGDTPPVFPAPDGLPAHIFRAYDIRGIVGDALTEDIVRRIGLAIGTEAHMRGVHMLAVGRDGRNSSPDMQRALVAGLRDSGRDVIDVGQVPTPLLYFAAVRSESASGVMVTGSHNPPDYNGLKIMLAGETLHSDAIQALKHRVEARDFVSGRGSLRAEGVIDDYIRRIVDEIPAVSAGDARRIVVDCGNGAAGSVAPRVFRELGHEIIELYCEVDGNFPGHHPDPSDPGNLRELIESVRGHGADLGIAFDGDGDRLGIVDGAGTIIWPDRQMMLFARDVLSRQPGAEIIFDVKCSGLLVDQIERFGGRPVMWKTGHSFIKSRLRESGAPLAGEMSGHIFFADRWYGFDDALYAAARLVQILVELGAPSAEVFRALPAARSTPELRVRVDEGLQGRLVDALLAGDHFPGAKTTTIDGLRVDFPDGWGLVRASNTEPCLVLRFEGADDDSLDRIAGMFRRILLSVDPTLNLPFRSPMMEEPMSRNPRQQDGWCDCT